MSSGPSLRSSLQRVQGRTPSSPEEVRALAATAWHDHQILLVPLGDPAIVINPIDRQMLENIGTKLYGKRCKHE